MVAAGGPSWTTRVHPTPNSSREARTIILLAFFRVAVHHDNTILLLLAFMVVLVNYYSTQRQPGYDDIEAAMLGRNDDDRLPAEESLDDGKAKSKHKMCECCVRGGQGNSFFCRPSYISYVQTDRQDVVSAVKRRSSRQSSGHPSIP